MSDTQAADDAGRQKIIDRIKKLLSLSANNPSENEAAAAAAKAQELLAQYNLDMDELRDVSSEPEYEMDSALDSNPERWIRWIAAAVAELYFCRYYYFSPTKFYPRYRHVFVGQRHNIDVAKEMTRYIVKTINRLSRQGMKTVERGERSPYQISFREAATSRIDVRIHRMIEEARTGIKSSTGKELVLASLYDREKEATQAWVDANMQLSKPKKKAVAFRTWNAKGYADGVTAGNEVGLHTQVGQSKTTGIEKK